VNPPILCALRRQLLFIFVASICVAVATDARAQFEQLAAKVPSTANAMVLLDAEKLMASKLAEEAGWKGKFEQAFAAGLVTISPDTKRMVIASQLDLAHMTPLWELVLADFAEDRSVAQIARNVQGSLDTVGDLQAVVLSDDSYCVQLEPSRLGVFAPANRQTVARWLREVGARSKPDLAPYLQSTLVAGKKYPVVIAMDLEDALPLEVVRTRLAGSAALTNKKIDIDAAAKAIGSLRGIVLEVSITDAAFGQLMIHFREDATVLAPVAKPLLLEVLGNQGATIDDIASWKVTTEPQRFTFTGPLSAAGCRRVLSLIDHPIAALIAADKSKSQSDRPESSKAAYATQQYFKSIMTLRDDLREQSKEATTLGESAMWMDKGARRIDRLPLLNVDPEMLAYGRYITARMRDASQALKGIGINSAAQKAQVYQQYSASATVSDGYYGGSYSANVQWNNVGAQRRAISAQQRAQGATTAQAISVEMDNQTVEIRQVMTQKYQINF
jgi:hypothetical protein